LYHLVSGVSRGHIFEQAPLNFIPILFILFAADDSVGHVCFQLGNLVTVDIDISFLPAPFIIAASEVCSDVCNKGGRTNANAMATRIAAISQKTIMQSLFLKSSAALPHAALVCRKRLLYDQFATLFYVPKKQQAVLRAAKQMVQTKVSRWSDPLAA